MEKMTEKKRSPRALYRCTVSLWRGTEPIELDCYTKNISTGGVCVVLPEKLEIGQEVRLQLQLDDGNPPADCHARVKWTLAYRTNTPPQPSSLCEVGFQYTELSSPDLSRIERVVTRS